MADILEKIQALPEEHRERIMGEYTKMKLRQRERRGWDKVNEKIKKRIHPSKKLVVANLRQFIPQTYDTHVEELTSFIDKNFFEYRRAPQLEKHTNSV